jgi:hypothetical protein
MVFEVKFQTWFNLSLFLRFTNILAKNLNQKLQFSSPESSPPKFSNQEDSKNNR